MKGTQSCGNCRFWCRANYLSVGKPHDIGHCRRNPPVGMATNQNTTVVSFPLICDNEWCGEWKFVEPQTFDEAAASMCRQYLSGDPGDRTLALATADKLRELAEG